MLGLIMRADISKGRFSEWRTFFTSAYFIFVVGVIALLLGGVATALLLGGGIGKLGVYAGEVLIGSVMMAVIVLLRQDELAAMAVIAVHVYVDWFLALYIVSPVITLVLLVVFFLARSPRYPWVKPRALWLWALFLVLTIFPAIQGATNLYDAAFYYPNIIFGAFIIFWLGSVIARDSVCVARLFKLLAAFGALLAIHTIIQARTGVVLFDTSNFDAYLAKVSNFGLANSDAHRAGSFFENPDWNGTFFATMLFLPLGLLAKDHSLLRKMLYLSEILLMAMALLFTYSVGAWIAALAGIVGFVLFAGRSLDRILIPLLTMMMGGMLVILFPAEVGFLLQHASNPAEVVLRSGAWQTAINIINAFPLTGIGLGLTNYLQRAEPYRVAAQYIPLAHPHNSYLELGAMAGLPVLMVFLALLFFALWRAWRNWLQVDSGTRCLLGGGMASVIALSINSLSVNDWTLPPLAAIGWLILGVISSPLLAKCSKSRNGAKEK